METKLFELRDRATFIPIFAMQMGSEVGSERWLLSCGGYGMDNPLIMVGRLQGGPSNYNYYNWSDRTFSTAHKYIAKNFDSLETGDVIDVEFILGETKAKKTSQRWED